MDIKIINQKFSVCKVKDLSQIDYSDKFCFIGKTDEELSLVDILLTFEDKSNEEIKRLVSSVVKTYKINGIEH